MRRDDWQAQEQALFGGSGPSQVPTRWHDDDAALARQLQAAALSNTSVQASMESDAALARRLQASALTSTGVQSEASKDDDAMLAWQLQQEEEKVFAAARDDAALARRLQDEEETTRSVPVVVVASQQSHTPVATIADDESSSFSRRVRAVREGTTTTYTDEAFGGSSWQRPVGRRSNWCVFRGTPRCDDVEQGALGSCWLVSSIAALSAFRNGALVPRLFVEQCARDSDRGVHGIRLCVDGRWRLVIVDERFPVMPGGRRFAFANCRRSQLFAPLLEKAYAKLCGSYAALEGGKPTEALALLTGCACREVTTDFSNMDELWATILSAHEARFVCVASSRHDNDRSYFSLAPGHAYAVVSVLELFDPPPPLGSGARHRLIRLANPHGSASPYRWRGAWSEGAPQWTPESLQAARSVESQDHGFFISLQDLCKGFDSVTICEMRDDDSWSDVRIKAAPFEIIGQRQCQATIQLCRPPDRVLKRRDRVVAAVLLVVVDASTKRLVASSCSGNGNTHVSCHLDSRRHLVVPVFVSGVENLVFQTSQPTFIQQSADVCVSERLAALAHARSAIPRIVFDDCVATYTKKDGTTTFIAYENRSWTMWLKVSAEFPVFANCATSRRGRLTSPTVISSYIPPKHAALVVVIGAADSSRSFSYEYQHGITLVPYRPTTKHHDPPLAQNNDIHAPIPLNQLWPSSYIK